MKKKNEPERKCPCGRIITDPNNKTGLCPKCQKKGNTVLCQSNCKLVSHSFEVVIEGQMKKQPVKPVYYNKVIGILKDNSIEKAIDFLNGYRKKKKMMGYLLNPLKVLKAILKRVK